jgi:hypothetical protein
MAIALAACSSSSKGSTAPTTAGGVTAAPTTAGGGDGGGAILGGAAAKLSDIASYKFSMTLAGGSFGSMLGALGGAGATGNEFTIAGTIVAKPDKAADITMAGMHIIEIGGNEYIDMSGTGTFISTPATGTSLADSFAPATMFSSMVSGSTMSGFNKVGSDNKNGVNADHYQGTEAVLSQFGTASGVEAATWTADLWIATDGGYPVSMAIIGTATDKTLVYEILFDITNVNDPANKITAPSV